jgi:hypothetical protein
VFEEFNIFPESEPVSLSSKFSFERRTSIKLFQFLLFLVDGSFASVFSARQSQTNF